MRLSHDPARRLSEKVISVEDGEEAILLYMEEMKAKAPFDLVIMELTIPGGRGGEVVVREIYKIDPEAKVDSSVKSNRMAK
ncbi:MAG: hypothetical protein J7L25_08640 [Deltaproteobacteria bacterium]|nr:hypothetical protein [Candidatus Tharpella aukensis]